MTHRQLVDRLECSPVVAAVGESKWNAAVASSAAVLFHLKANLLTVEQQLGQAHAAGKTVFVHLDLMDGLGKDKTALQFLVRCGADGIISTRAQLIRAAREQGLLTIQRFFALDSQGLVGISEMLAQTNPDFMEIMPGITGKVIRRFAGGSIPVIAGGLIETKAEVTEALSCGALAVSTGKNELWEI